MKLLIGGTLVALALSVLVACIGRMPRDLRDKKLDQRVNVDLEGLGTASLPPTFELEGVVNSGSRRRFGGDLTSLEYHLDERRLTLRFLQGQHNVLGGYRAYPVILDVTLFNAAVPSAEIDSVSTTTIGRFYSPTNTTTLASAQWQPEERAGDAVTRIAHAKDPFDEKHPRWLIIHTDPARRIRVDLFAWQDAYSLDEAKGLVRDVAASVQPGDHLARHFADIKTFDQRMEQKRDSVILEIGRALSACGVPALVPGSAVGSETCVARLSDNRRDVYIARYLGSAPLSATTFDRMRDVPAFPLAIGPNDYPGLGGGSIDGLSNLDIFLVWWDAGASRWRTGKLQGHLSDEGGTAQTLEPDVARGLLARELVHLFKYSHYDVEFHPDRVNTTEFLALAERFASDLANGKILKGVTITKQPLGKS